MQQTTAGGNYLTVYEVAIAPEKLRMDHFSYSPFADALIALGANLQKAESFYYNNRCGAEII